MYHRSRLSTLWKTILCVWVALASEFCQRDLKLHCFSLFLAAVQRGNYYQQDKGFQVHLAAGLTKSDSSPSSSSSTDSPDSCSSSDSPSSICSHQPKKRKSQSSQASQSTAPPSTLLPMCALTPFPLQDKTSKAVNAHHGSPIRMVQEKNKTKQKTFNSRRKFSNQISISLIIQKQPRTYTTQRDLGEVN